MRANPPPAEESGRYERLLCVMIRRPPLPGESPFQRGIARQLAGLMLIREQARTKSRLTLP